MADGSESPAPAFHLLSAFGSRCFRAAASPVLRRGLLLPLLPLAVACAPTERVLEYMRDPPESAHEEYLFSLEDAGLHETALGLDWLRAATDALHEGPLITIPYREEGFFLPREPSALGYRFHAERGQRISIELVLDAGADARVFTDLYRGSVLGTDAIQDPDELYERLTLVASGSSDETERMEYSIRITGEYTLRIQPELLRGGRYEVAINTGPSLAFPVQDRTTGAILSFFGAARDGGMREHHGVDIFAPRGTPVVAAVEGTVRVGNNDLGGKVVWLRDEAGNQSLYHAHLDSQIVRHGDRVRPGDTLGLVGNTGNARTTPPHLHFGIYARGDGPVDPLPFLREGPGAPAAVTTDRERYGEWARVTVQGGRLRQSPGPEAAILDELDRFTPLRVVAGSGDWFRVRLPDGRNGFIAARLTEPLEQPLHRAAMAADRPVQSVPDRLAPVLAVLPPGSGVGVLGQFGDFIYVQPENGPAGWVSNDGLQQPMPF